MVKVALARPAAEADLRRPCVSQATRPGPVNRTGGRNVPFALSSADGDVDVIREPAVALLVAQ